MKRNELIVLNGNEYTLELNRESLIKIEKYTNLQNSMKEIQKPVIEYQEDIAEDENPFADEIDLEEIEKNAQDKLDLMCKLIDRAFWIWLYPTHKLSINEVKEILKPYYEDDEKMEYITTKYSDYMELSVKINQEYIKEQKNLKAQANK